MCSADDVVDAIEDTVTAPVTVVEGAFEGDLEKVVEGSLDAVTFGQGGEILEGAEDLLADITGADDLKEAAALQEQAALLGSEVEQAEFVRRQEQIEASQQISDLQKQRQRRDIARQAAIEQATFQARQAGGIGATSSAAAGRQSAIASEAAGNIGFLEATTGIESLERTRELDFLSETAVTTGRIRELEAAAGVALAEAGLQQQKFQLGTQIATAGLG